MNTRKLVYWIELILYSILLAFIIPVIFNWILTHSLEITIRGIKDALFFGILVPFLIFLSKNVKNDFFKAFIALLAIFTFLLFMRAGYLL
jgi:hypothetical protein